MAAQKSTELRRRLHEVQADQTALQRRQDEFESYAVAAPSATWPEVAAKARYLIQLFAVTPETQDPRRPQLIAKVLDQGLRRAKRGLAFEAEVRQTAWATRVRRYLSAGGPTPHP